MSTKKNNFTLSLKINNVNENSSEEKHLHSFQYYWEAKKYSNLLQKFYKILKDNNEI